MRKIYLGAAAGIFLITVITVSILMSPGSTLRSESVILPCHIETFMQEQVDLGPRYPGSEGAQRFITWIHDKVPEEWEITMQNYTIFGIEVINYMITHENATGWPSILVGAHYDTRKVADQDSEDPTAPVPGANDAASGVAGILEMMDHLGTLKTKTGFVLFDAEDQGWGGMEGWNYIMGSEYFASQMSAEQVNATDVFILYDMIANDDMELEYEGNSDVELREAIWDKAHDLGYDDIFLKRVGYNLIDDHRPFLDLGIPSVDIIDFNYPEWHTTEDNMDNVSAENAAKIVDTVLEWLFDRYRGEYIEPTYPELETCSGSSNSSVSTSSDGPLYLSIGPIVLIIITRRVRSDHLMK